MGIIPGRFGCSLETPESRSGYRGIARRPGSVRRSGPSFSGHGRRHFSILALQPETPGRTRYNKWELLGGGVSCSSTSTSWKRRRMAFGDRFRPGTIQFSGSGWKQLGELEASGSAELMDPRGLRTIRVRGRIRGAMGGNLRPLSRCRRDPARSGLRPFLLPDERHSAEGGDRDRYLGYRPRLLRRAGAGAGRRVEGADSTVVAPCAASAERIAGEYAPNAARISIAERVRARRIFQTPVGEALRKLQFHKPS